VDFSHLLLVPRWRHSDPTQHPRATVAIPHGHLLFLSPLVSLCRHGHRLTAAVLQTGAVLVPAVADGVLPGCRGGAAA